VNAGKSLLVGWVISQRGCKDWLFLLGAAEGEYDSMIIKFQGYYYRIGCKNHSIEKEGPSMWEVKWHGGYVSFKGRGFTTARGKREFTAAGESLGY